ncbi:hypothetical protein M3Y96_00922100 [Aphelenchoides besseyi]|nr:hypothetical protein M3Y96_00922100 [Aphelenchoides besseyi]
MFSFRRYRMTKLLHDAIADVNVFYRNQWSYCVKVYKLNQSFVKPIFAIFVLFLIKYLINYIPYAIRLPWHEEDADFFYQRPIEEPLEWPHQILTPFDHKYGDLYDIDYRLSHPMETDCRFPILMPSNKSFKKSSLTAIFADEPDLMNDVRHYLQANCTPANGPILVQQMLDGSILVNTQLNSNFHTKYECFAQEIQGTLRPIKNETHFVGPFIKSVDINSMKLQLPKNRRFFIQKDQFHVFCKDENDYTSNRRSSKIFEDAFTYVPFKKRLNPPLVENTENFSIAILVLDSTSRNQFFRHAPQTLRFMKEQGFQILHGFNKVADNSAVNLLPLLAGKTFSTKFHGNRHLVDESMILSQGMADVDFEHYSKNIIELMKHRGCATQWNDDIMVSGFGLFNYNIFKGFWKPLTDYYYRPYYEYMYRDNEKFRTLNEREICVNGELMSRRMLQIWERFSTRYAKHCHFSFNFLTHITHDTGNTLELIDQSIYDTLIRMKHRGVFDNTIMILMGDHGNRIADIQSTYSGRIEERMPMFSMYFPEKFKRLYPEKLKHFMINKNRLVSHFDLHETLQDILNAKTTEDNRTVGGQSLLGSGFKRARRCSEARIVYEHCTCMELVPTDLVPQDDTKRMLELLREYVADVVANSSCLNSAILYDPPLFLPFTINAKVRAGIRCPKAWNDLIQNGTMLNRTDHEIFEVEFRPVLRAKIIVTDTTSTGEPMNNLTTKDFVIRTRVHYNRFTKYIRLVAKPHISSLIPECSVNILEDLCMCYNKEDE